MKFEKNDKAAKELKELAANKKMDFKEMLLSDAHLDEVSKIFYKHMPKVVKWSMKEEKFKDFYKNNRVLFVNKLVEMNYQK